jgi:hypothetical protein
MTPSAQSSATAPALSAEVRPWRRTRIYQTSKSSPCFSTFAVSANDLRSLIAHPLEGRCLYLVSGAGRVASPRRLPARAESRTPNYFASRSFRRSARERGRLGESTLPAPLYRQRLVFSPELRTTSRAGAPGRELFPVRASLNTNRCLQRPYKVQFMLGDQEFDVNVPDQHDDPR